ncbi:carbamoyltransferase HypF [Thermomonospora umbrina]|uniref:Carbamoyltransferase n=1 Tax=Thermomonospora umbrina TaxID=111806 RepID=A0A3D9T1T5_9ACTN|nr:carbamoyltransferase HypF [Thermomonospora umbrina]REE97781.1 hydrogenase maturation protein HypF [Thermomonospora umbrina]
MDAGVPARMRIRVEGMVRGVGFRPFVYGLAGEYGLAGFVGNDTHGVFVEAEGDAPALAEFAAALELRPPPLARVERVVSEHAEPVGERGFRIVDDDGDVAPEELMPPDVAPCDACLAEIADPKSRRHRYAFTECAACGPRFTVAHDAPYERRRTAMAGFTMCGLCAGEHRDPKDRRFQAHGISCPGCGPTLRLVKADGGDVAGDPIETAAKWLLKGKVLAVKGPGGYHLAALADHRQAVNALRARLGREEEPFPVMAPDLAAARALVRLDPEAEDVLAGPRRPIVLVPLREDAAVADTVAPGVRDLGVILPSTPLHHLLAARVGRPFVLVGADTHRDDDARARLAGIADGFLLHDREIRARADDSVVRVFRGRELPLRRARGHVPSPVPVKWPFHRHVLACGAARRSTFCVAKGHQAFVSHHVGDLRTYNERVSHFCRLFSVRPEIVAHDLHPEYLSTKYALEREGVHLVGVQHHHAHIASCLAENGESGPVIGVAFDGLGHGEDGTLWGGELLIADLLGFERAGHLVAVPMPGGPAAVREPWRMAAAYLDAIYGDTVPPPLRLPRRHGEDWAAMVALCRSDVGGDAPRTSSAGRLFDAVAALVGLRDEVAYDGQAAFELEQRVDPHERGGYAAAVTEGAVVTIAGADLVRCVANDLVTGVGTGRIAARFHNGLARAIVRAACALRERTGLRTVALSGGVFQNVVLLDRTVTWLHDESFRVLIHRRVPSNDGGISLGQAVVAAARARGGAVGC